MSLKGFSKVTFHDEMRILMMRLLLFAIPLLFASAAHAADVKAPIVVELFSSQSCSSCPPADAILAKIAHNADNGLIVLGCHVTYWDHLRWKDTLSLPECTERQRDYAGPLEQHRSYTPNMVVNGRQSFIGSREFELDVALRKAREQDDPVVPIKINPDEDGYTLELPELPAGQQIPHELNILTYMTNQTVAIKAGENDGETVTYAHAVSGIIRLAPWQGKKEVRVIKAHTLPAGHLHGVVAIAQEVRGGPIRAAGEYRIYFN